MVANLDLDMLRGLNATGAFAVAGYPVPDGYGLIWNSRAGWIARGGGPDVVFEPRYIGRQRVMSNGWVVRETSLPTHFDEPMAGLSSAFDVCDSFPPDVLNHFRRIEE